MEDQKIYDDIYEMSGGAIRLSDENFHLGITAPQQHQQPQRQFQQQRKRYSNNNQKRKY